MNAATTTKGMAMNNVMNMTNETTMGTFEISKLLGVNHSDLTRSAERLAADGVFSQPLAESDFTNDRGRTYKEYRLNRLDSIILVAQNSPAFTAALVKRWDELEQGTAVPAYLAKVQQVELAEKQHEAKLLEADAAIDRIKKAALLEDIQHHLDIAKMLGRSFDINQYVADHSLSSDVRKHLSALKGTIGATVLGLGGIEKPYGCVTDLLRTHRISMRPVTFNLILGALGVITIDGHSKVVTEYGKRWGFNFKSGDTTNPRWYEDTFHELVDMVYSYQDEE